jgi:hypothetical protein
MPRLGKSFKPKKFFHRHWRTKVSMVRLARYFRSFAKAGRLLGENRALVRYHVNKFVDPAFHPKPNGGASYPRIKLNKAYDGRLMDAIQKYYSLPFLLLLTRF